MKDFFQLAADFHRRRLEFVHTELDTGAAFAGVAQTERKLGNTPRAAHNLVLAENACAEAKRRLDECDPTEMRAAFNSAQSKLEALEATIADLRRFRL
jgi:hypothetical protein